MRVKNRTTAAIKLAQRVATLKGGNRQNEKKKTIN
jgi:hypothetical protein